MLNKKEPYDWSNYQKTYNNAIDLTAQAIGWARKNKKPISAIILQPSKYDLFFTGLEVIAKEKIDPLTELYFDGVLIKRGRRSQFDSLVFEYY